MNKMYSFAAVALAMLVGSNPAWADAALLGTWSDNAPDKDQIGTMTITKDSISIGKTIYHVTPAGAFGKGESFAVSGVNRKEDPFGCGPNAKVSFLAIEPLPTIAGTTQKAVRVYFYAGKHAPDPSTISRDHAVCEIHPFGRD